MRRSRRSGCRSPTATRGQPVFCRCCATNTWLLGFHAARRSNACALPNENARAHPRVFHRACERDLGELYQRAERLVTHVRRETRHLTNGPAIRPSVPDLHMGWISSVNRAPPNAGPVSVPAKTTDAARIARRDSGGGRPAL